MYAGYAEFGIGVTHSQAASQWRELKQTAEIIQQEAREVEQLLGPVFRPEPKKNKKGKKAIRSIQGSPQCPDEETDV